MRGKFGDKDRLQHILISINEIENYLKGSRFSDFEKNSMMRYTCIKQLEIIGEQLINYQQTSKKNITTIEMVTNNRHEKYFST
jgi:uncharacterized protein with HEPN domain